MDAQTVRPESPLDRYITERYVDALCRDTGVTREQAITALRRALDLQPGPAPARAVRPHNPTAVLAVLVVAGTAWTVIAGLVVAVICGWRP